MSPYAAVPRQFRTYEPVHSPLDPCPALSPKVYVVPPELFVGFQPRDLAQAQPLEALHLGTLWPALYSPYPGR